VKALLLLAVALLAGCAGGAGALQPAVPTLQAHFAHALGDWLPERLAGTPLPARANFVVAADGSGTHTTLQAAFDALPARGSTAARSVVHIRPGTYRERPCLRGKAPVLIAGDPADAAAVRIVAGVRHATPKAPDAEAHACHAHRGHAVHGTSGSATFVIASSDVQLRHLTVENDAGAGAGQAVALYTRGDRIQLDDVRVLGHQDTLLVRRPSRTDETADTAGRVWIDASLVAGDVDFVFGDATLAVTRSTLLSRAGRGPDAVGHVLAPSTRPGQRGFLVLASRFAAEPGVGAGRVFLGRAWDEGVAPGTWQAGVSPDGEALVAGSDFGPHLAAGTHWAASTSRRPFDAALGRLAETGNRAENALSREVLAEGDGWASQEGGTRGGADALPSDVHRVHTRAELLAALAPVHRRPRIVEVAAFIDLAGDEHGRRLGEADFADPAFGWDAYAAAYDPAVWGRRPPAGALEDARRRSAARQRAHVVVMVPSRTTLVGVVPGAGLRGGMLRLERVDDVIVRELRLSDARDLFPAWDPSDGRNGHWNSEYDNVSLFAATRVWIDRCTLDHGDPITPRQVFGQPLQHHDGLLDITRGSDLVTVSLNHFRPHDKTSLVGGGDGHRADEGRLRVSYRHNLWDGVNERAPRVRYGRVHVAHNLYRVHADRPYGYSLGIGHRSRLLAEGNVWQGPPALTPDRLVRLFGGERFSDRGSVLNGRPVSLLQALRAVHPAQTIAGDVGWSPPYHWPVELPEQVLAKVLAGAGADRRARRD
jgi:pectin methylesterase-like acyl-CoA thioesterase/pectate lyase